jgi:hypothetical protein
MHTNKGNIGGKKQGPVFQFSGAREREEERGREAGEERE